MAALLGPGQQQPLQCCCVKVMGSSHIVGPARQYFMSLALQAVLVSAGFDAAEGDPLGGCRLTPHGYGRMTVRGDPRCASKVDAHCGWKCVTWDASRYVQQCSGSCAVAAGSRV